MAIKKGRMNIKNITYGSNILIKKCYKGSVLLWENPIYPGYLTFSSTNPFTVSTYAGTKNWAGTLEYSTDKLTWATWTGASTLSSVDNKLYLRGTGNSYISRTITDRWVLGGSGIYCSGTIESLLDYNSVLSFSHPTMANNCFAYMFYNCTQLAAAPNLSSTTLKQNCYANMFARCTSLIAAPNLLANSTAYGCYSSMFANCSSLTTVGSLPALAVESSAYYYMFYNCTSLVNAPTISATTVNTEGCYGMFSGCTSLINAPSLSATSLGQGAYQEMFENCTSLTSLPSLPATALGNFTYQNMFTGCTSIKISETQTGEYQTAYRIPTSGTGTEQSLSLYEMFKNTGGTFAGTPNINTTYYTSNTVV